MNRNLHVSVVLAVFNGEEYIREQLDSILVQLKSTDELIISYDASMDNSLDIVLAYERNYNQIRVVKNDKSGVVKNFENGLKYVSKDIVLFSDQDDYWLPNKIERIRSEFRSQDVTVVIHDAALTDENLEVTKPSTFALRNGNTSILRNLLRLSYIGCCLAFRSELISAVIPIPTVKRSHDWWTGTICSTFGKMVLIDEVLILHRIHDNNVTPKKRPGLPEQINIRLLIAKHALIRYVLLRREIKRKLV